MKTTIGTFKATASRPQQAIAVIFDLQGFSQFFSQPDVQDYVAKYLNIVLSAFGSIFDGGDDYWTEDDAAPNSALPSHIHSKFLGDGGLYVFDYNTFTSSQRTNLINRLFNLTNSFNNIVAKATEEIPILDIPKKVRIGISAGSVYKLTYANSNREEFIGYCINLASRLQNYCPEIGFIVSARMNFSSSVLQKHAYKKVVAMAIKGFPQEIVLVDVPSYEGLDANVKKNLFKEIE